MKKNSPSRIGQLALPFHNKFLALSSIALTGLLLSASAKGADSTINFSPAVGVTDVGDPTGDLNIDTAGTLVQAFDANGAFTTASGIMFSGGNDASPATYTGFVNFAVQGGIGTTLDGTDLNNILGAQLTTPGGTDLATLTLNGLTSGNTYQIQLFVQDSRQVVNVDERTELVSSDVSGGTNATIAESDAPSASPTSATPPGPGTYTIGTFVADGTSQIIDFDGSGSPVAPNAELNAFVLRDVTNIPEPSTYALLGLGALALTLVGRRAALKI